MDLATEPQLRPRHRRAGPILAILGGAVFFFVINRPVTAPAGWGGDFESARAQAVASRKDLVVAFHSESCPPCVAMDRSVLGSALVTSALFHFVPVRVMVTGAPDLAARYDVLGTPSYIIMSPNGTPRARTQGYQTPEMFSEFLRRSAASRATEQDD